MSVSKLSDFLSSSEFADCTTLRVRGVLLEEVLASFVEQTWQFSSSEGLGLNHETLGEMPVPDLWNYTDAGGFSGRRNASLGFADFV